VLAEWGSQYGSAFEDHQCRCWERSRRGTSWDLSLAVGRPRRHRSWASSLVQLSPGLPHPDKQLVSPKRHVSRAAILTHQEGRKTSRMAVNPPSGGLRDATATQSTASRSKPNPRLCALCAWQAAVIQLAIDLAHAPQAPNGQRNRYTWSRTD